MWNHREFFIRVMDEFVVLIKVMVIHQVLLIGMDLFLTPKIREMGFAKDKFIHFHRTSARRARVLWNCMNESLAEPFLWFWVSGKGILWNYSIKLQNVKNADIMLSKNSWNQCNTNGHHQEVNNHLPPGGHHREINEKVKTIYLLVVFLSCQIT